MDRDPRARPPILRPSSGDPPDEVIPSLLARGLAAPPSPRPPLAADLKVGLSVSLSGPDASLGIPYAKGMQAAMAYRPEIDGRKVELIVLDDASDPSTAGRNARKLSTKTRSTC